MVQLYEAATGLPAAIVTDRDSGEFSGPLYDLCHGCLEAAGGEGPSGLALGAALKRVVYPRNW